MNDLATFTKITSSVTRKNSPNVYKSCQKMIPIEKFDTFIKIA